MCLIFLFFFLINQKNNSKLIVFFNGWSMDKNAVSNLNCSDFDILEINNYTNFNLNLPDTSKYQEKYLVAWSMGVYVSNLFYSEFKTFDKKIAVAGTSKMIDNNFGIKTKIYDITIKLFNEKTYQKFLENMGIVDDKIKSKRSLNELKNELISLKNLKLNKLIKFNKAIIPMSDIIVPSKNQIRYWENIADITKINSLHYPFNNFKSWYEIIC